MLKVLSLLKKYKMNIIGVVILVFFQSMFELYLPTLMSDIVNNGIAKNDVNYIFKIGKFMLLIAAIGTVCSIFASFFASKTAVGFGTILRKKIFQKVESFSMEEFDKVGTASLITRTTNDVNQIQQVLIIVLRLMVMAPLTCIGGIIMAMSKDIKLSLIILIAIPILGVSIYFLMRKGLPLFKSMQFKLDKLNQVEREKLVGIRVIRAFNKEDYEKVRFDNTNKDFMQVAIKVNKIMAVLMPIMMVVLNFTIIGVIWFGSIRIDNGNMQIGDLMAFIQYIGQIMMAFIMMSMMFIMIPRAQVSIDRIAEVLSMNSNIIDSDNIKKSSEKSYVEFKNVTFSYPGAEKPVVENISFNARPGEVTAIIGGTGSGKSTLINLIPRFYDANSGSILIDGIDIKHMSQEDLRRKIGLVPQKATLFTGTISENIKYGNKNASIEEIKHAAKIAQAEEFISEMNDGFDSIIAQGGSNVSGGQKQRLSIARALVRKPEIYIFDDSFSALDFKTEARLRSVLKDETKEATVFMVAQRISSIMDADRIIVLNEGKIVGTGKHRELLKNCSVYKEIASSQLSEEELA